MYRVFVEWGWCVRWAWGNVSVAGGGGGGSVRLGWDVDGWRVDVWWVECVVGCCECVWGSRRAGTSSKLHFSKRSAFSPIIEIRNVFFAKSEFRFNPLFSRNDLSSILIIILTQLVTFHKSDMLHFWCLLQATILGSLIFFGLGFFSCNNYLGTWFWREDNFEFFSRIFYGKEYEILRSPGSGASLLKTGQVYYYCAMRGICLLNRAISPTFLPLYWT